MKDLFKKQLLATISSNPDGSIFDKTKISSDRMSEFLLSDAKPTEKEFFGLTKILDIELLQGLYKIEYPDFHQKKIDALVAHYLYNLVMETRVQKNYTWSYLEDKYNFRQQDNNRFKNAESAGKPTPETLQKLRGFLDDELLDKVYRLLHGDFIVPSDVEVATIEDFVNKSLSFSNLERIELIVEIARYFSDVEKIESMRGILGHLPTLLEESESIGKVVSSNSSEAK